MRALIPCRTFRTGKSRLAHLGPSRAGLARELFAHVLEVAGAQLDGVLVATDGDDVAELARGAGAEVILDRRRELAGIVDDGLAHLAAAGHGAAVVLMADLPLLEAVDVVRLTGALAAVDLVIAPDRELLGTNALAMRLPAPLPTCFGNADSYPLHLAAARERRLAVATIDRDGLAFDLDRPNDLAMLPRGAAAAVRRFDQWLL